MEFTPPPSTSTSTPTEEIRAQAWQEERVHFYQKVGLFGSLLMGISVAFFLFSSLVVVIPSVQANTDQDLLRTVLAARAEYDDCGGKWLKPGQMGAGVAALLELRGRLQSRGAFWQTASTTLGEIIGLSNLNVVDPLSSELVARELHGAPCLTRVWGSGEQPK